MSSVWIFDEQTIDNLRAGKPPIFEPGLDDLIRDGLRLRAICPSSRIQQSRLPGCGSACGSLMTPLSTKTTGPISRRFLTGSTRCRALSWRIGRSSSFRRRYRQVPADHSKGDYPGRRFAYTPENLRLGRRLKSFFTRIASYWGRAEIG